MDCTVQRAIIILENDIMENNSNMNPSFGCEGTEGVLAMARVPIQPWCPVYDSATAMARGTLFPALDLPFLGRREESR